MTKKLGYSPVSIIAAGCGTIATAAAASNPVTAPFAVGIGTAASAIVGGTELNEKEQSIKEQLDNALDEAWTTIDNKYRISINSEDCLLELKREMMGGNTSVDEVTRNLKDKKLENSLSIIIRSILGKYWKILNRDAEIIWDDAFIDSAALDIATILVHAMRSVFENVDHLLILKAIVESADRIVKEIKESERRLTDEIRNQIQAPVMIPSRLTEIPPSVNLIGRDKDIEAILGLLEQHDIVSIHAYGGVGKTVVAKKIINNVKLDVAFGKSPYKYVAWVTSTGDLKSDLTALNLPFVNEKNTPDKNYEQVCIFLQSTSTFLVIDNIDSPLSNDEMEDLNTIVGQTKVLITARADIEYAEEYPLNELDSEDALLLFYWHFTRKKMSIDKIKERSDYPFAENIVEAATRNALFVELIGKMAYMDHWTLERLWESLCKDVFGLDSRYPVPTAHGDDGKLLEHVKKLYKMSNLSERQKEIMSFIVLFPAEHSIFFDVFKWAGFEDDEVDNLGELQKRGWIERDDGGYLIHTMVKGSVEQQQGKVDFDEKRYGKLIYKLTDTNQYMPRDMVCSKVREHIVVPETICKFLIGKNSKQKIYSYLYHNLARVYSSQGDYDKALEYYEKSRELKEEVLGKWNRSTAVTYNDLAGVYNDRGDYDKALLYYGEALAIKEEVLGKWHRSTAVTYNDLACVYRDQGDYGKALEFFEKALAIKEKILGEEHLSTAVTYNDLAGMYRAQGDYDKALHFFDKALVIKEKVLGRRYRSTAVTYNDLACVYRDQGDYGKALEFFDKALAIKEKVLGKEHLSTALTYNDLACVYRAQGEYDLALSYYEKALEVFVTKLGEEHPHTKQVRESIELLQNSGN